MRSLVLCLLLLTVPVAAAERRGPSPDVLAVQVMLDRLGFSTGEIDGRAGINLKRALTAFQEARRLTASGALDDATRQRLAEETSSAPPLVDYTLTDADLAGPFTTDIPNELVDQAKLPALGYRSPLEMLGERFHVNPALLKSLNPGSTFTKAGERISVPNVERFDPPAANAAATPAAAPAPAGTVITVTKATSTLTVTDASGALLFLAPVTSGSRHDPLPIGQWKVNGVQRNPRFHYNPDLFWDANPGDTKAMLAAGPNNPVGVVWIDINKPHYGLHGTPEPGLIGHVESHGCVRLTNWDAQRVAQWARPGTKVIFK